MDLDVCDLPITWTGMDTETWIERCMQPTPEPQKNNAPLLTLSILTLLLVMAIAIWRWNVHQRHRPQPPDPRLSHLQRIVTLERILQMESADRPD
jgi:hypothetical protein